MTRFALSLVSVFGVVLSACSDDGSNGSTATETTQSTPGSSSSGEPSTQGPEDPTTASQTTGPVDPTTSQTTGPVDPTTDPPVTTTEAPGTTTEAPGTTTEATSTTDDATSTTDDATTDDSTTGEPAGEVYDPDKDGPFTFEELDGVTADNVPVTAYYPVDGPEAGPYPVVTIAHGFNLPPEQYTSYAERLATHGYIAINVDFTDLPADHVKGAEQVLTALDWAGAHPVLKPIADTNNVGTTGHSLGGKVSVLAAIFDGRVKASITLDPVDSAPFGCQPAQCPDVSGMLPIDVPLGFLGETLDGAGGFMPCAPTAENFQTFYAKANAPALQVTVNGANHMSFLDDVAACDFICEFCQQPTLDNATVNALSKAYVVAFYGRYLRGNTGYTTYLTGAEAQARYVDPGIVSIQSK